MNIRPHILLSAFLFCGPVAAQSDAEAQALAESYQRMNAELQELGAQYQQRLAALSERFKQAMQEAATNAARAAAQRAYQDDLRQLQHELQAKTRALRQASQQRKSTPPQPAPAEPGQQMQAELQEMGVRYGQRITALGDGLERDLQQAATAEDRTALLQDYQDQIRLLQQQAQAETAAIRKRYENR